MASAEFVSDDSIPDRLVVPTGDEMVKSWSLRNNGSARWPEGTKLTFINRKGSVKMSSFTQSVPLAHPNELVSVNLRLKFPSTPGFHQSDFRLFHPDHGFFGPRIWALVKCVTPVVSFQSDVTVNDGKQFPPKTGFVKTWRFKNSGVCHWPKQVRVVFADGHPLGGQFVVRPKIINLSPGRNIDVSMNFVSPENPGFYHSKWKFVSNDGVQFGSSFWCEIKVTDPASSEEKQIQDVPQSPLNDRDGSDDCRICLCAKKTIAFVPCGHLCVCAKCADMLTKDKQQVCPICRAKIKKAVRIYT